MKKTIVIYGSSTGTCQAIANTIASKLGTEAIDVAKLEPAHLQEAENLYSAPRLGAPASCRTTGMTASPSCARQT